MLYHETTGFNVRALKKKKKKKRIKAVQKILIIL